MKHTSTALALLLVAALSGTAVAEDAATKDTKRASRGREFREKMLEKFDADGDGKLSEKERGEARKAMQRRRAEADGDRQPRRGEKGRGEKGRGEKGHGEKGRCEKGRGEQGRRGGPDPAKLFDKFDADGDNMLSRKEFRELTEHMRRMHQQGGPKGARLGGDRDGERRGGPRRDGDSDRPRSRRPPRDE